MTQRNGTLIRQLFTNTRFSSVNQYEIQGSIALQLKRTRSAVTSSRGRIVAPRAHAERSDTDSSTGSRRSSGSVIAEAFARDRSGAARDRSFSRRFPADDGSAQIRRGSCLHNRRAGNRVEMGGAASSLYIARDPRVRPTGANPCTSVWLEESSDPPSNSSALRRRRVTRWKPISATSAVEGERALRGASSARIS